MTQKGIVRSNQENVPKCFTDRTAPNRKVSLPAAKKHCESTAEGKQQ